MRVILRASGISHFRLAARNEKTAFLLFHRSILEAYLNDEHKQFPQEMGLLLGYPREDVIGLSLIHI